MTTLEGDGPIFEVQFTGSAWLASSDGVERIRARAVALGGHATAFRGSDRAGEVFQPLSAPLAVIHRRLKQAFDPAAIFNPGRLYPEF